MAGDASRRRTRQAPRLGLGHRGRRGRRPGGRPRRAGRATRCRWPTAARARSTRSGARTAPRRSPARSGGSVDAAWRLDGRTAVIEMARASGLAPRRRGRGQRPGRRVHGRRRGADRRGARRGRHPRDRRRRGFGDDRRRPRRAAGPAPARAAQGRSSSLVACDVRTGFLDAAEVFAPQKGATPAQVELLRRRLERLAQVYRHRARRGCGRPRGCRCGGRPGRRAGRCWGPTGVGLRADRRRPRALRPHRGRRPRDHRRGVPRRPELRGQGRGRCGGAGGGGRRAGGGGGRRGVRRLRGADRGGVARGALRRGPGPRRRGGLHRGGRGRPAHGPRRADEPGSDQAVRRW